MSHLGWPRIVFSGDFQADVSTVNNDIRHYDNATFESRFQEWGQGAKNGWWNPVGGSAFRLLGCKVHGAVDRTGTPATGDPVLDMHVGNAPDLVSGKLVDLDPQNQGVSMIFGMRVRIGTADGTGALEGVFRPAAFRDLVARQQNASINGQSRSATFRSVLEDLHYVDSASKLLAQLAEGAQKLCISLTTFGYYYSRDQARYTSGRLVGSIAPWTEGEPLTVAVGRRLTTTATYPATTGGSIGAPVTSRLDAEVDEATGRVTVDLSNTLPITDALGGQCVDVGTLTVALGNAGAPTPDQVIGVIEAYTDPDWLLKTGGIVDFVVPDKVQAASSQDLRIVNQPASTASFSAQEENDGKVVLADDFVLRIDPPAKGRKTFTSTLYARQRGKPVPAGTSIPASLAAPFTPGVPTGPGQPSAPNPQAGFPGKAVRVPKTTETDANGVASLKLECANPGNPRGYIDGQVYWIAYGEQQLDAVQIHLREAIAVPPHPTWDEHIQPIMQQYANLYPVMSNRLFNLADLESVRAHRTILELAFSLRIEDPNHMPVTRDLSGDKRDMLLSWLREQDDAGNFRLLGSLAALKSESAATPEAADTSERPWFVTMGHGGGRDLD